MNDNYGIDKVILSIVLGVMVLLISINLGDLIYNPDHLADKHGYAIEIADHNESGAGGAPHGLPDVLDMKSILAAADPAKGEEVFRQCLTCHISDESGTNRVGPNLWGIVGRQAASVNSFQYSEAMKSLGSAGKVWGYEELYRYLYAPKKYVPGTKMAFAGVKDDKKRADLILYLRSRATQIVNLP